MTEPTTSTGQAILYYGQQSEASMSPEQWSEWWRQRILVIEAEAKAQERERLRAAIMDWERYDLYFDVLDLLADPEDDR